MSVLEGVSSPLRCPSNVGPVHERECMRCLIHKLEKLTQNKYTKKYTFTRSFSPGSSEASEGSEENGNGDEKSDKSKSEGELEEEMDEELEDETDEEFEDGDTRVLFCKSSVDVTSDDDEEMRGKKRPNDDMTDYVESMSVQKKQRFLDEKEQEEERLLTLQRCNLAKRSSKLIRAKKLRIPSPRRIPKVPSHRSTPSRTSSPTSKTEVSTNADLAAFGKEHKMKNSSKEDSDFTFYERTTITMTSSEYVGSNSCYEVDWRSRNAEFATKARPKMVASMRPKGVQVLPVLQHRQRTSMTRHKIKEEMSPNGDATLSSGIHDIKSIVARSLECSSTDQSPSSCRTKVMQAFPQSSRAFPSSCLKKFPHHESEKKKSVTFSPDALVKKDAIRPMKNRALLETYPFPVEKGHQMFMSEHVRYTAPILLIQCADKQRNQGQKIVQVQREVVQMRTSRSLECAVRTDHTEANIQNDVRNQTRNTNISDLFPRSKRAKPVIIRSNRESSDVKAKKVDEKLQKAPVPNLKTEETGKRPQRTKAFQEKPENKDLIYSHRGSINIPLHPLHGKTLAKFKEERERRMVKKESVLKLTNANGKTQGSILEQRGADKGPKNAESVGWRKG